MAGVGWVGVGVWYVGGERWAGEERIGEGGGERRLVLVEGMGGDYLRLLPVPLLRVICIATV